MVDVCRDHGVWFEAGELKLVLEFVESGGLSEARRLSLGLPLPRGAAEQERVADAIARSLSATNREAPLPDATSDRWLAWVEARLEELVRLYLSWSRR